MKSAESIRIPSVMKLVERRVFNILLYNASEAGFEHEEHRIEIVRLRELLGYHGKNTGWIMDQLKALSELRIEWDTIGPDSSRRVGFAKPISSAEIINNKLCVYSIPKVIRDGFSQASLCARINLAIQNEFSSPNSLALWEFLRLMVAKTPPPFEVEFSIQEFRELFNVPENQYSDPGEFNRKVVYPTIEEVAGVSDLSVAIVKKVRESRRLVALIMRVDRKVQTIISAAEAFGVGPLPAVVERMQQEFNLGLTDAQRFAAKFVDHAYLNDLLDDYLGRYRRGMIAAGKLAPYTRKALENASPQRPLVIAQQPLPAVAPADVAPAPEKTEPDPVLEERKRRRTEIELVLASMPGTERAAIEQAWLDSLDTAKDNAIIRLHKRNGILHPGCRVMFLDFVLALYQGKGEVLPTCSEIEEGVC
jgi:hypothetical protein